MMRKISGPIRAIDGMVVLSSIRYVNSNVRARPVFKVSPFNNDINISETKVKHYINNKVLFSYQQMKQDNKRNEEVKYGKVKISKSESKNC